MANTKTTILQLDPITAVNDGDNLVVHQDGENSANRIDVSDLDDRWGVQFAQDPPVDDGWLPSVIVSNVTPGVLTDIDLTAVIPVTCRIVFPYPAT